MKNEDQRFLQDGEVRVTIEEATRDGTIATLWVAIGQCWRKIQYWLDRKDDAQAQDRIASAENSIHLLKPRQENAIRREASSKGGRAGKGVVKSTTAEAVAIAVSAGCTTFDETLNYLRNNRNLASNLEVDDVDDLAETVTFWHDTRGETSVSFGAIQRQVTRQKNR